MLLAWFAWCAANVGAKSECDTRTGELAHLPWRRGRALQSPNRLTCDDGGNRAGHGPDAAALSVAAVALGQAVSRCSTGNISHLTKGKRHGERHGDEYQQR